MSNIWKSVFTKVILIILVLIISKLDAQDDIGVERINKAFKTYVHFVQPEQVNFTTDKSKYIAGEKIWFNVEIANLHSDKDTSLIHIELLNPDKEIIYQKIIRPSTQRLDYCFRLSDTLGSGIYLLRAYTNWMRNFDSNLIKRKAVLIMHPDYRYMSNRQLARLSVAEVKKWKKQKVKEVEENTVLWKLWKSENSLDIRLKQQEDAAFHNEKHYLVVYQNKSILFADKIYFEKGESFIILHNYKASQGEVYLALLNSRFKEESQFYVREEVASTQQELIQFIKHKDSIEIILSDQLRTGNYSLSVQSNPIESKNNIKVINSLYKFGQYQVPSIYRKPFQSNIFNYSPLDKNLFLDWEVLINNKMPESQFRKETNLGIKGHMQSDLFKNKKRNEPVMLTVLSEYYDSTEVITDQEGEFEFNHLLYYDTVEVMLESYNHRERNTGTFIIETPSPPIELFSPEDFYNGDLPFLTQEYKKQEASEDPLDIKDGRTRLYNYPDHIIDLRKEKDYAQSVFEAIRGRSPGLIITGAPGNYHAFLGGKNPNDYRHEALYLIDGVEVGAVSMNNLSMEMVEKIEIVSNPGRTAVFGIRGQNGIISVFTRRKDLQHWGNHIFMMLGYSRPEIFETSKIDSQIYRQLNISKTLFYSGNTRNLPERIMFPYSGDFEWINYQIQQIVD